MPEPPPRSRGRNRRIKPGAIAFGVVIGVLGLLGALQLVSASSGGGGPGLDDHWHAALGVDICGRFLANAPSFEERAGSNERAGLHSHGDGLVHVHPFADDETGDAATLGRFFDYGGGRLTEDRIVAWEDTDVANGGTCPDGRPATVRWALNGVEQDGNPADHALADGDVITVAFLPDGDPIPEPPSKETLPNPVDLQGG